MGVGLITPTWRAVGASVAGAGHRARGSGCEDACAVEVAGDGRSVLLVVADGAGSARLAARGSSLAVAVALEALRAGVAAADAVLLARGALEDVAAAGGHPLGDLATTLLVVRAGPAHVETAQVGDGAVVVRRGGAYEAVAPDRKGEYLNETSFLTSSGWRGSMRTDVVASADVDGVVALTDGLQLLAFDLASGTPHRPFFDPFVAFAASGAEAPVVELEAFLGSDRVGERTDDDVTLAVAALADGACAGGPPSAPA